jgi:hypothetical protein
MSEAPISLVFRMEDLATRLLAYVETRRWLDAALASAASMQDTCPTPGRTTSRDPRIAACRPSATSRGARTSDPP